MYGLYIHIPFCAGKCPYCDFYSLPGRQGQISSYIDAVLCEAEKYRGEAFRTLYIGGGTPSLLGASGLRKLMAGLRENFQLGNLEEATIEANPESADSDFFNAAKAGGFTRVSIGVQSLNNAELRKAGRAHNARQAVVAIRLAFGSGFTDVSVDIMIGLPGQTCKSLKDTIHKVLGTGVTHISSYCLTVEDGTPLASSVPDDLPCDDEQAVMYDLTRNILKRAGFVHYEISNFALPGRECRHNLNYWEGRDYLGLGPAAASHIGGRRIKNESNLEHYLRNPLAIMAEEERLELPAKVGEEAMLRLRLLQEGINLEDMASKFGHENVAALAVKLENMAAAGNLVRKAGKYFLAYDKVLISNTIMSDVL